MTKVYEVAISADIVSEVSLTLSVEKVKADTDPTLESIGKLEEESEWEPLGAAPCPLESGIENLKHALEDEHSLGNAREKSKAVESIV